MFTYMLNRLLRKMVAVCVACWGGGVVSRVVGWKGRTVAVWTCSVVSRVVQWMGGLVVWLFGRLAAGISRFLFYIY